MTTLSLTIGAGKQSAEYKEIIKVKDKRIKISIKSDSYLKQCHAISYLWSNTGWVLIHSIPYSAMNTEKELRTSIDFEKKKAINLSLRQIEIFSYLFLKKLLHKESTDEKNIKRNITWNTKS